MTAALVVLAHGDGAHVAQYQYAAARLASAGHEVRALDGPDRSDDTAPTKREYTTALAELERTIAAPGHGNAGPVVLLANGSDAAVVLRYGIDHQPGLAGLVLSSPLAKPPLGPVRQLMHNLSTTLLPDAPAQPEPGQANPDPVVDVDYMTDPLTRLGQIPMSSGAVTARREAELVDGIETLVLPTLLLWGIQDGLTPPGGAEHLLGGLEHTALSRVTLDCPYHDVLGGPQREAALDAIVAWLAQLG